MSRYILVFTALMLMLSAVPTWAVPIGTLQIQFTGLDLSYANNTVSDATDPNGNVGDPADADPLDAVSFSVGGSPEGTITSNAYADVSIPGVAALLDAVSPNVVTTTTFSSPGYFDLLFGTSPSAAEYLQLNFDTVTVTYLDIAGIVQFLFGGTVADVASQELPFDIIAGSPVTVSFSTNVVPGTKTSQGGIVTGFDSSGTGEINGLAVPEPAVCLLAALCCAATLATRGLK